MMLPAIRRGGRALRCRLSPSLLVTQRFLREGKPFKHAVWGFLAMVTVSGVRLSFAQNLKQSAEMLVTDARKLS
jgi:hypothetical protein